MNLEKEYQKIAKKAIKDKLITKKEWDTRFDKMRDEYGHSFVHLLEAHYANLDYFITVNEKIINNRKELEKRFKVPIRTPGELMDEMQEQDKRSYIG